MYNTERELPRPPAWGPGARDKRGGVRARPRALEDAREQLLHLRLREGLPERARESLLQVTVHVVRRRVRSDRSNGHVLARGPQRRERRVPVHARLQASRRRHSSFSPIDRADKECACTPG